MTFKQGSVGICTKTQYIFTNSDCSANSYAGWIIEGHKYIALECFNNGDFNVLKIFYKEKIFYMKCHDDVKYKEYEQ